MKESVVLPPKSNAIFDNDNKVPTFDQVDLQIDDVVVTVCNRLSGLSLHVKPLSVKKRTVRTKRVTV